MHSRTTQHCVQTESGTRLRSYRARKALAKSSCLGRTAPPGWPGGGGGSPRESVRLLKGARRREVDQEFGDFATAAPTLVGRARRAPERMAFVRGDAPAGRICVQRAAHLIIRICGAVEADRQTQYVQCIVFREWMRSHLVFRVQGSTEEMASFVLGNLRGPPRPSILVATARDMAPAAFDTIRSGLRVSPHH